MCIIIGDILQTIIIHTSQLLGIRSEASGKKFLGVAVYDLCRVFLVNSGIWSLTCWCIDTERVLIDMVLWSMARTYSKNIEIWRVAVVLHMDDNV